MFFDREYSCLKSTLVLMSKLYSCLKSTLVLMSKMYSSPNKRSRRRAGFFCCRVNEVYSTTMGLYFGTSVFMMHQPMR